MHDRSRAARRHWAVYLLAAACVAALVAAVLVVGPPSATSRTSEQIVTVARGVVQSTVSGTGTVEAAHQLDVNFETGGTLTHVYVHPGERVVEGQELAAIDPTDAQATLDQAQASLVAAEAAPVASSSSASSGSSGGTATTAAASASSAAITTPATTTTTPANTAPAGGRGGTSGGGGGSSGKGSSGSSGSGGSGSGGSSSGGGSGGGETAGQKAANVASAQAAVDKARAALAQTTLTAPMTGVVASIGASVGEQVSGGGSASASSGGSGGSGGSSSGGGGGGSGGSGSSGSGSSAFIVLADLDAMNVVVPFSESDVGKLRAGQPATISVNALPGQELAAHVISIATLPTSSNGVVSYDVRLRLDQLARGLKSGMTASAQVVVDSVGDALNVASAAISGRGANASVTLVQGSGRVRRAVVTGVVGDGTTQILGGLREGDRVAIVTQLPSATSGASGFGGGAGGGALGGGGGGVRRLGGGGFGGGGGPVVVGPGGGGGGG